MAHILIVDDEDKMRFLLSLMLERSGYKVDQAPDGLVALEKIKSTPYDMVISDIKMPGLDGIGLLQEIKKLNIPCPVIFITAFATVDSAVRAMRQGATDYITKPFEEERIQLTVERTLNVSRILKENTSLKKELKHIDGSCEIIFQSKEMAKVIDLAGRVAKTDSTVLLTGESGTGKEILARYIHCESERSHEKFVPVNCAAISASLVESELFGHEKGAFTSADKKSIGKFEYSSSGSIFLDEIGDLPMEAQSKLLRVLQEKKIQRVGGNEEIPIDVRVICATNKNLEELVENGSFRQDLLYRINVFPIQPPPLNKRKEDIEPLAKFFLKKFSAGKEKQLSDGAMRILNAYHWPGNVRELANAMERAAILSIDQTGITSDTLSFLRPEEATGVPSSSYKLPSTGISLEKFEEELVEQALAMTGNNQSSAAKLLGLTRAKFRVLMKQANRSLKK